MDSTRQPQRLLGIGVLLPALVALWLYWPVRNGGLLSDDLLLHAYSVVPGRDGLQPAWQHVYEDLQGPWLFGNPWFYRPLTTLTFVLEHWLTGGIEGLRHWTNLGLFALSVFGLARLAGELLGARAALVAGMLFAVHPVANEAICWPCARSDVLITATGTWACLALVHLRRGNGRWSGCSLAIACVLALLSKETALVLAPLLAVLDLALGGSADLGWRRRLVVHAALLPLWSGYLLWRSLIGTMPPLADLPASLDWSHWPSVQVDRLARLVAPGGGRLSDLLPWSLAALLAVAWTHGVMHAAKWRWLGLGAGWLLIAAAPNSWQPVFANMVNSRSLLLPWMGVAFGTAASFAVTPRLRWLSWLPWLLLGLAVVGMASSVRALQAGYSDQWLRMRALREQVAAAGTRATAAAPLAFLSAHIGHDSDVPFLDADRAYSLAVPPLVPKPIPFVGLGSVLDPNGGADLMQGNVLPWRMLWQHGATLFYWLGQGTGGTLVTIGNEAPPARLLGVGDGVFTPEGGVASPWTIGAFEVVAGDAFAGGRLVWSASTGHVGELPVGPSHPQGDGHAATVDIAANAPFLMFGTLGGIVRVAVELRGAAPVAAHALHAAPFAAPAPLRTLHRGAPFPLAAIGTRLPWDSLPNDADPASVEVVLMDRSFAFVLSRAATAPLLLPPGVAVRRWQSARLGGEDRVYYYLQCRANGAAWRSQVDWFIAVGD